MWSEPKWRTRFNLVEGLRLWFIIVRLENAFCLKCLENTTPNMYMCVCVRVCVDWPTPAAVGLSAPLKAVLLGGLSVCSHQGFSSDCSLLPRGKKRKSPLWLQPPSSKIQCLWGWLWANTNIFIFAKNKTVGQHTISWEDQIKGRQLSSHNNPFTARAKASEKHSQQCLHCCLCLLCANTHF